MYHCMHTPGGPLQYSLEGHPFAPFGVGITSNAKYLISVSNIFIIWDLTNGDVYRQVITIFIFDILHCYLSLPLCYTTMLKKSYYTCHYKFSNQNKLASNPLWIHYEKQWLAYTVLACYTDVLFGPHVALFGSKKQINYKSNDNFCWSSIIWLQFNRFQNNYNMTLNNLPNNHSYLRF